MPLDYAIPQGPANQEVWSDSRVLGHTRDKSGVHMSGIVVTGGWLEALRWGCMIGR
jgi:hypothetical protein